MNEQLIVAWCLDFQYTCTYRYPDSRLGKLFNGEIDITLDTLKQHYFIDRDGPSFRHILNFLRHNELIIPSDYQELNILQAEANYYGLNSLVDKIERVKSISSTCSWFYFLRHTCLLNCLSRILWFGQSSTSAVRSWPLSKASVGRNKQASWPEGFSFESMIKGHYPPLFLCHNYW